MNDNGARDLRVLFHGYIPTVGMHLLRKNFAAPGLDIVTH